MVSAVPSARAARWIAAGYYGTEEQLESIAGEAIRRDVYKKIMDDRFGEAPSIRNQLGLQRHVAPNPNTREAEDRRSGIGN